MAEIRTVTTLRRKREEMRRAIIASEEKLDQAKADLSHVSAAIAIFEGVNEGRSPRSYIDTDRLFTRGEPMALAKAALSTLGQLDTRELVIHIMAAKAWTWRRGGLSTARGEVTPAAVPTFVPDCTS